jgi:hypothetical protein
MIENFIPPIFHEILFLELWIDFLNITLT